MIKGRCNYKGIFKAGIERYYLSKKEARYWDSVLRDKKVKKQIIVSVIGSGKAQVKDFLVDGKSIKNTKHE